MRKKDREFNLTDYLTEIFDRHELPAHLIKEEPQTIEVTIENYDRGEEGPWLIFQTKLSNGRRNWSRIPIKKRMHLPFDKEPISIEDPDFEEKLWKGVLHYFQVMTK
jgi:hypothetical protein